MSQEGQPAPAQAAAANGQPKAPKLAPAPVPQQTPWKAPTIDPSAAQATFEAVDAVAQAPRRNKPANSPQREPAPQPQPPVQTADASSAKRATTGKEKWVPYQLPITAANASNGSRQRQAKRQSAQYRQRRNDNSRQDSRDNQRDNNRAAQNGGNAGARKSSASPAPQSGSRASNGGPGGAGNQRPRQQRERQETPQAQLEKLQVDEHSGEPAGPGSDGSSPSTASTSTGTSTGNAAPHSGSPPFARGERRHNTNRMGAYAPRPQNGPRKPRDPRFNGKMGYYGGNYANGQVGYVPVPLAQGGNVPVYPGVTPPQDVLMLYLVPQVDFYFSLENLLKDMFLRSNMNNEGLVPISVIASFKRVRDLTPDVTLVAQACAQAPNIEVVGSKVRAAQNFQYWVLAEKSRTPAGLDNTPEAEAGEERFQVGAGEEPRFQVDQAVPFVPRSNK